MLASTSPVATLTARQDPPFVRVVHTETCTSVVVPATTRGVAPLAAGVRGRDPEGKEGACGGAGGHQADEGGHRQAPIRESECVQEKFQLSR